ncbi:unnamed protein product [Didymodactylos carnosus]|uniref:ATP-dependent RNA helicase n=1 Tax=Didymodactylos carnosus TaxID=1234261 RepID=A0A815V6G3_9BILA|nr:unnamed protein product [Didymodactylos carnosus]CAF4382986.1 unnamed protein product [Didymodactylos carnosus]
MFLIISGRSKPCPQGDNCSNPECDLLHSDSWESMIVAPTTNPVVASMQKIKSQSGYGTVRTGFKTIQQRWIDRKNARLPVLECREQFLQRLEKEKALVITAETGSGKSTQLAQYTAEHDTFGQGLTVCTQPRVMAAISIARRVAEEYDGGDVGYSVGYSVGGGNTVNGNRIMFMTDATLVRQLKHDPNLDKISVLIIDEAHERSLYTDIVLGIANILRKKRPDNFYVVITSATIDPKPFLNFFNCQTTPLHVPGRVYPVTLDYQNPPSEIKFNPNKLISEFIIPTVLKTLKNYNEGHCLVFLPGQAEIEQALKHFRPNAPDNVTPLPLFGSLSPEEQENVLKFDVQDDDMRMIVFCTNVAETSLTVPGVKLVIDSGLAKEARYETKRRMTVLELVRISRSSADQRKGRVGRLSTGHCIRLFDEKELTRQNIEPEILHSSLDAVILQLSRIRLDPLAFPFMDKPLPELLQSSVTLLKQIRCIDSVTNEITKRGELFAKLPFDPRLSEFVLLAYEKYNLLDIPATIAAILSAPGSIFFMGGTTKEKKIKAKQDIVKGALGYDSDLLYSYEVFQKWIDFGKVDENDGCTTCNEKLSKSQKKTGCRRCRVQHTIKDGLNNKVYEIVQKTRDNFISTIMEPKWNVRHIQLSISGNTNTTTMTRTALIHTQGAGKPNNIVEYLGECLKLVFADQLCTVLIPHMPSEGVRIVSANVRAKINDISTILQKNRDSPFHQIIAMSITQLPSGLYVVDRIHPLVDIMSVNDQTMTMVEAVSIENTGSLIASEVRKKVLFNIKETWATWSVCIHDTKQARLQVFCPLKFQQSAQKELKIITQDLVKTYSEYEVEEMLPNGTGVVKVQSGLAIANIELTGKSCRVKMKNLPCENRDDCIDWIRVNYKVDLKDRNLVKWLNFQPSCLKNVDDVDDGEGESGK